MRFRGSAASLFWIVTMSAVLHPQEPAQFEVASVKPNKSGSRASRSSSQPDGGYIATNTTLRGLIQNAYSVRRFEVTGGPGWIDSDRFDIVAKAPANSTEDQFRPMLRGLLAERFKLAVHTARQEQPIYALVLARRAGNPGPQLHRSSQDCSSSRMQRMQTSYTSAGGMIRGTCTSIDGLTASLVGAADRVVVDRTNLPGEFDFELRWTSETSQPPSPDGLGAPPNDSPSLFTALQEQLGLRLEPSRGPVEILVIDNVEQPSPN